MRLEKDPCGNCGSVDYTTWKMWHEGREGERVRREQCNKCSSMKLGPDDFRDAAGNKVTMTQEQPFSYATGTPVISKKQFSETLKKMNLVQTDGRPTPKPN